jgi:hypothetical protein
MTREKPTKRARAGAAIRKSPRTEKEGVDTSSAAEVIPSTRITRSQTLIDMMRAEGGASAVELAKAIGWQVHSVRGFIAGTLKKRSCLAVTTVRTDKVTRYSIRDVDGAAA